MAHNKDSNANIPSQAVCCYCVILLATVAMLQAGQLYTLMIDSSLQPGSNKTCEHADSDTNGVKIVHVQTPAHSFLKHFSIAVANITILHYI